MREYLVSLSMTALIVAFASVLSPDGKMKKSVSLALSLILISALVLPLFNALANLDDVNYNLHIDFKETEDGEIANDSLEKTTKDAVNLGIKRALCERFDIEEDCVSVDTELKIIGSEVIFLRVDVHLTGTGIFSDLPRIKKYIKSSLGAECEVYLSENKQSYS